MWIDFGYRDYVDIDMGPYYPKILALQKQLDSVTADKGTLTGIVITVSVLMLISWGVIIAQNCFNSCLFGKQKQYRKFLVDQHSEGPLVPGMNNSAK